jgi:FtsZ-interacting cell division protein ZipA
MHPRVGENAMHTTLTTPELIVIGLIVLALIVVIAAVLYYNRKSRKEKLQQRFGSEYDRAVAAHGSERKAETALENRQKRVEKLNLRDLEPAERERYLERWRAVQLAFVDSPRGALTEADDVISAVMQARGYPVTDFEQRAADISVDHPRVTENYRAAHTVETRLRTGQAATTEDLRTAMIHYRALFDELVQPTLTERRDAA